LRERDKVWCARLVGDDGEEGLQFAESFVKITYSNFLKRERDRDRDRERQRVASSLLELLSCTSS
jgi:hypothetical protein